MKRHKISQACRACRDQKKRCSGTTPCLTCARLSKECIYSRPSRRQNNPSKSPTVPVSDLVQHHETDVLSARPVLCSDSRISVSTPDDQNRGEEDPEGNFTGPFSPFSWLYRAWQQVGKPDRDFSRKMAADAASDSHALSHSDKISPPRWASADEAQLPRVSAASLDLVLRTYSEIAMATYHFLHYPSVRTWLEQLRHRDVLSVGHLRAAICFLALAHGMVHLRPEEKSALTDAELHILSTEKLVEAATAILDAEQGSPTLESIQARLIKVHHLLSASQPNSAWYLFGLVVQMAYTLGIHQRRPRTHSSSLLAQELRRRVFWAVYATDRYISITLGRPTLIQDDMVSQPLPTAVNDEDLSPTRSEPDPDRDCVLEASIQHAALARIVGQAIRQYYIADRPALLALMAKNNEALTLWKSRLPPFLSGQVRPSSLVPVFQRQAVVLKIFYLHSVILINRPCHLYSFQDREGDNDDDAIAATAKGPAPLSTYYESCLDASVQLAKQLIEFSRERQRADSFWFTQNITFNAVSILYIHVLGRMKENPGGTTCNNNKHNNYTNNNHNSNNHSRHKNNGRGNDNDNDDTAALLEIAQQAHHSLAQASVDPAPCLPYTWALDALKQEVLRQNQRGNEITGSHHHHHNDNTNNNTDNVDNTNNGAAWVPGKENANANLNTNTIHNSSSSPYSYSYSYPSIDHTTTPPFNMIWEHDDPSSSSIPAANPNLFLSDIFETPGMFWPVPVPVTGSEPGARSRTTDLTS